MITEIPTDEIKYVSLKIQEIINLAHDISVYDQGYIYLLDIADRLLLGCRERIKADVQGQNKDA